MIGYGIPETEICLLIKNPAPGKPINLATFRKYFAAEIATYRDFLGPRRRFTHD